MTYAITGASGQLGRLATAELLERVDPSQVVLITRTPDSLADLAARGVEVRAGDFERPDSLPAAFADVDRLLLVSTDVVGARLPTQIAATQAAAQAGVQHVLYTSIARPERDNPAGVVPDHAGTEQALRDSGLGWTFLRNNIYAEMQIPTLQQAAQSGQLVTNAGAGRYAYVTRADAAAAAAAALASGSADNTAYDITGPESLSSADLAALAARIGGRDVAVVDVDDDAYVNGLIEQAGLPAPFAELLASFHISAREGYLEAVSPAVEQLTGRLATPLSQLVDAVVPPSS